MIRAIKEFILKNINYLPPSFNYYASLLNQEPRNIFGLQYKRYLERLTVEDYNESVQLGSLLKVVNYATENVPYYKDLYKHKSIKSLDDFRNNFKFIDKDIVLNNFNQFKSIDIDYSQNDVVTTGGTSGKPLQLLIPKNRYSNEWATIHYVWKRVGYNFHHRAVLRNHRLPNNVKYVVNPITKEFIFDNFRLNDDYMHDIYSVLKKYNIQYIHAYPSAAYQFSSYCYRRGLDISFIKAFLSGSENIYDDQLNFIKEKLGVRLFSWYGHSEKLLFGAFCEYSDFFHMEPSYGFFELIDTNGDIVTQPGEIGEMVGTTLNNFSMPLIRYKTGDYAEFLGNKCPSCGREVPVLKKILGRWDGDKIYNVDGTYVTTTALNLHSELYTVINGLQYYQKLKGQVEVRIIKGSGFNLSHEKMIFNDISSKLAPDTIVKIVYVDNLMYKKNGKFLMLVSDV